jgi:type I restriction enzyme R subunit
VVISRGGKKDPPLLRRCHLSDDDEKRVRLQFRKPEEQPKILIVTEKLLTGFDAPILYCIYLDKPMRDHVLLQAIARVNRPYEDDEGRRKPSGFVLDFVGIFDNLEKALAFDSKDVKGVIEGVDVLKDHFKKLIAKGQNEYLSIIKGKKADKQVEALLEHFRDKELRQEYYSFFIEIQDVYEILSPDAFLRPYIPEYNDLTRMYYLLRANYDRGKIVDKEFLRKTAKLVQKHTESGIIEDPIKTYALDAKTLDKIAKGKQSNTVKIFNLLRVIHGLVGEKAATDPYLIQIGDRAREIAEAFERRQMTTKEALEALERLMAEFKEAEKSRDDTGLSPEAFAVYWFLKREGLPDPMKVAEQVAKAFKRHPYWQTSTHHEQEVRKAVYKSLIDAKVDNVVELATRLMTMLRRASR